MLAETIKEGVALYRGEQPDGSHDVLVRITVFHADPSMDYRQEVTLRVDPSVFEGLDSDTATPVIRVRKQD